jgi:transcriptional regulator with XRE-family HTH domain
MSQDVKQMSRRVEPIDEFVSIRMGERRRQLGLMQHDIANAIGVTHQQYQKYETAKNRVSAARLYEISLALDVPMTFFFDGLVLDDTTVWDPSAISEAEVAAE